MNRLLNLYTIIGLTFVLGITCFCILRYGNPQWNKWVYIFQANVSPKDPELGIFYSKYSSGYLEVPKDYSGIWRSWRSDGSLWTEENIYQGKRKGEFKSWHHNGQLAYKANIQDKEMGKYCKAWHLNGSVFVDSEYNLETRELNFSVWNDNNIPEFEMRVIFYPFFHPKIDTQRGEVFMPGPVDSNIKSGKEILYDDTGKVKSEYIFKDGKKIDTFQSIIVGTKVRVK